MWNNIAYNSDTQYKLVITNFFPKVTKNHLKNKVTIIIKNTSKREKNYTH